MSRERPRFRRDLKAVPLEVNGESYVELRDPASGASFVLYDFEYRVALAFDGLPLATVIPWLKLSTGMELTEDQLTVFADRLAELGFLESDVSPAAAAAVEPDPVPDPVDVGEAAEVSNASASVRVAVTVTGEQAPEVRNDEEPSAFDTGPKAAAPEPASPPTPAAEVAVVLPAGPPRASSSLLPRAQRTPPPAPWATPRPVLTPAPATFELRSAHQRSARRRLWRSVVLYGSLGVLAATAVVAVLVPFVLSPQAPSRPRVRVHVAAPTTVFRFFDGSARLRPLSSSLLRFPVAGKVAQIVTAGTKLVEGDVVASLEGAETKALLDKLAGQRERLAFARQMQEGMHQAGNAAEEERQSSKVESRNAKLEKTLQQLAEVAVVAVAPGTVEQVLAAVGDDVDAKSPAVRLQSEGFRATFALGRSHLALARKLPFCRLEIDGNLLDCRLREAGREVGHGADDDLRVDADVAVAAPSLVDRPARLARARYDAATLVPSAAVVRSEHHDVVWLVSPRSRLEPRPVSVAEADADVVVVVQGLDPGDRIVVVGPPYLRPGLSVAVE